MAEVSRPWPLGPQAQSDRQGDGCLRLDRAADARHGRRMRTPSAAVAPAAGNATRRRERRLSVSQGLYRRERLRVGKVSLSTKFYQAIGALPEALKNWAFSTFLLFYYNQVLHVGVFKASVVVATALIIDAAVDPLLGSFSDHLNSRLGRRHPLMYLSAIPIAVGLYLVFSPPAGLSETLLLAWLFGTVAITHVSMSVFVVPWTALYAEFSDDYAERTTIVTWRYAVGWLGSLVFILCTWRFIFASTPAYNPGQLNPHAYALFGPVAALAILAAIVATTYLTRREIPYLLQPVNPTPRFSFLRVWRDVSSTFVNRDFLVLFIGALLYAGISGATDALGLYVNTYFWGLAPEQLQYFSLAIVGAIVAFVSLGFIGKAFDKKTVLLATFAALMVDGIAVILLRLAGAMPANGTTVLLVILVANEIVRTWLVTLLGIMFVSMLADTIDVQELATGLRQEGVFSAALAFSGKATAGVGAVIAGFLLQQVVHWPLQVDPRHVGPQVVMRLGLVAGVLVPLLLVIPLLLGWQYRITREKHALTRLELDRRRAAAHAPAPDDAHLELEMAVIPPGASHV
jgi:GPH family glycoside/pentoside/hexuronide:cation symporter